jgi:hypothetical protein
MDPKMVAPASADHAKTTAIHKILDRDTSISPSLTDAKSCLRADAVVLESRTAGAENPKWID